MPAISVVIPTYNAAKFLREALDSLLAQTFPDWEAVCVNDGSTDNSLEILQEYAARDGRFRILDGPNGGYGKAMNRGMDAARGKYMAILEPDDFIPGGTYGLLFGMAEEHGLDVARGSMSRFYEEDGVRHYEYVCDSAPRGRVVEPWQCPGVFRLTANTVSALYRLEWLRGFGFRYHESPGAAYQDAGMAFLSAAHAGRYMACDRVVYCYRFDNPASSVNTMASKPLAYIREYAYIKSRLMEAPEVWERVKGYFADNFASANLWMYRHVADEYKAEFLRELREPLREAAAQGFAHLPEPQRRQVQEILQDPQAFISSHAASLRPETAAAPAVQGRTCRILGLPVYGVEVSAACTRRLLMGIPVFTRRRTEVQELLDGRIPMRTGWKDSYRLAGVPLLSRTRDYHGETVRVLGVPVRKPA